MKIIYALYRNRNGGKYDHSNEEIQFIGGSHECCYMLPIFSKAGLSIPWSQRFFLIFLCKRDQEQAAKRRQRVVKAMWRERKTSGYLGLESYFHVHDSCQTLQIANKNSDRWQFSKHVFISRYFFKWG